MSNSPVREVRSESVLSEVNFDGQTVAEVIEELKGYLVKYGDTVFFDYTWGYDGGEASLMVKVEESDESFNNRVAEYERHCAEAKEKALRKAAKKIEEAKKVEERQEAQERELLKQLREKYGE